jgi:hypothetical protein
MAEDAAGQLAFDRAADLLRECLRIRLAVHDMPGVATAMEKLAYVIADETPVDSARLRGAAAALRENIKTPLPARSRDDYDSHVDALVARLGQSDFDAAWAAGRSLDPASAAGIGTAARPGSEVTAS